ncbi:DEKNAAC103561 [Brettanomyces naardenensis]|uniref:DEKNAAC103561 n=1 Tax=Brettanomyces naardenensis TaxID=13370 RepID=A0A448YNI3_BRENA|nr:DEKNAAC103561 [Brettanomyces naardenensis]
MVEKRKRGKESADEGVEEHQVDSILTRSAEMAFPRGGESELTPLEIKEVTNQAKSDVLFEQKSHSSARSRKRAKRSKSGITVDEKESEENETVDSVSFRLLQPGSFVLGKIAKVSKVELVLSLADNLDGYIPITNVSDELTEQLEEYEEQHEDEEEEDDDEDEDDDNDDNDDSDVASDNGNTIRIISKKSHDKKFPSLKTRFEEGQFLRAVVVENTSSKGTKRIELSIEPEKVNSGMQKADFCPYSIIQVSVKSVEDHGAILNVGNPKLSGFISRKELKEGGLSPDSVSPGSVLLVTVHKNNGRTLTCKLFNGKTKKQSLITSVSAVDAILPGILVDATVLNVTDQGVIFKVLDLCNGSINFTHLGVFDPTKLKQRFAIESTVRARITASYMKNGERKVQLSLQQHILELSKIAHDAENESTPLEAFPIGHIFEEATVTGKDGNFIFLDVGNEFVMGKAHKSQVTEGADLDMDFKIGSKQKARIIGYSPMDNSYILTLDKEKIAQKFLKVEDLPVGEVVQCQIERIVPGKGIQVKIEDSFEGFVPEIHMSDVRMIYPERKFKIGSKVKGRVLRVSLEGYKPTVYVTLKKSLVNFGDETEIIKSIDDAVVGKRASATVERFYPGGCLVGFFGYLRGFLPNSEISETFVSNAEDHLKAGQTVSVRIIDVDKVKNRIRVSLRIASAFSDAQTEAMDSLVPGKSIVEAQVAERQKDALIVELSGSQLRGILSFSQVSDENYEKSRAAMKRIAIGSSVKVVVLSKDKKHRFVNVSAKPSLIRDTEAGLLPSKYSEVSSSHRPLHGFVKNVTNRGVFVSFADNLTGLVLPRYVSKESIKDLEKKFFIGQSVTGHVVRTDDANQRFLLSMRVDGSSNEIEPAQEPVDKSIKLLNEFVPGKLTKGAVKAVKPAQLIIQLAENQLGRIDVTDVFDSFDEIDDVKKPLAGFSPGDLLPVKVLGYYDSRNRTYLPVARKSIKDSIVELSARKSDIAKPDVVTPLELADVEVGSEVLAFVNNFSKDFLWVSLSPKVHGKVSLMELSDDATGFDNLEESYPIGRALKLKVKAVDNEHSLVELSARSHEIVSMDSLKVGDVVPARILKTRESYVLAELAKGVEAVAFITDALDDYTKKIDDVYTKNEIVAAKVIELDSPNNKLYVSLRTSEAKNKVINSVDDLQVGDIVRGFVKRVADNGVYVALSRHLFALVRVTDLSDAFLREWKQFFKVHQAVVGKILKADGPGKIQMTLKESEVNGSGHLLKRFDDLHVGDIFEGSVRRVMDFGVFVNLDGTVNVTGLCHHTQIADHSVTNIQSVFGEGDRVKVKILAIDNKKKQLSLGMKASYFTDKDGDAEMEDEEEKEEEEESQEESDNQLSSDNDFVDAEYGEHSDEEDELLDTEKVENPSISEGLSAGFDWTASVLEQAKDGHPDSEDEYEEDVLKKKKSKKQSLASVEDRTAEINTRAPESVSDFERLLVGNPSSSILWIQYMSFQLQLGEIDKAREIGKRALKTINYREEQEKLNVWIALLNLESMFGTDESLDTVFKEACQYMDSYIVHQKLVAICVAAEKYEKATELYQIMCKKFGFDHVPVWVSFGSFLIDRNDSDEAHKVLARALQVLPKRDHVEVVRKFAQLEFSKGDQEQGRSLFEGLLSDVPKRLDLWNVYIDQEIKCGDKKKVEDLFERVSAKKLSKKHAKFFFGKWLAHEEKEGDEKASDYVKAKAAEYAQKLATKNQEN